MTRARFAVPPTVADYGRMTQRARLAAAELAAERHAEITETRARLAARRAAAAKEHATKETELVIAAAKALAATITPDPPDLILERRRQLAEAANVRPRAHGWRTPA